MSKYLLLLATTLGVSMGAYAAPLCAPGTIATYEATYNSPASGCMVGAVTFTDFTDLSNAITDNEFLLSASTGEPGFNVTYTGGPVTSFVEYTIQYNFDPPPAIGSAFLSLDPPTGDVTAEEVICPGGNFTASPENPNGCFIGNADPEPVFLNVSNLGNVFFATADFTPVTTGEVRLDIILNGSPDAPANFDTVGADVGAPEPATFALLFAGLAGLGTIAYKRKASK